jgi:hypothetical protein
MVLRAERRRGVHCLVGAFNSLLWYLFQIDGAEGVEIMSTDTIFMFAILVYVLMAAGMLFTMREFNRITEEPSIRKSGTPEPPE